MKDGLIALLRDTFRGDQDEHVDAAMLAVARCEGDLRQTAHMRDFYAELVRQTSPYDDWWRYAQRRQKLHEHEQRHAVLGELLMELYARLDATRSER